MLLLFEPHYTITFLWVVIEKYKMSFSFLWVDRWKCNVTVWLLALLALWIFKMLNRRARIIPSQTWFVHHRVFTNNVPSLCSVLIQLLSLLHCYYHFKGEKNRENLQYAFLFHFLCNKMQTTSFSTRLLLACF